MSLLLQDFRGVIPFQLPLKDSREGPPCMVMFFDPPVQLMRAELKSEPDEVESMEATVTVVVGFPVIVTGDYKDMNTTIIQISILILCFARRGFLSTGGVGLTYVDVK